MADYIVIIGKLAAQVQIMEDMPASLFIVFDQRKVAAHHIITHFQEGKLGCNATGRIVIVRVGIKEVFIPLAHGQVDEVIHCMNKGWQGLGDVLGIFKDARAQLPVVDLEDVEVLAGLIQDRIAELLHPLGRIDFVDILMIYE